MGHELRTPLSGILGFSELLERRSFGPLTERQRIYVKNIQTCGWCLQKLLSDLVDLSKIEAGKLSLSREWTSLDSLVEAALGDTRTLADGRRITLGVSMHSELPKVWVDPVRMQQVLGNLLAFAVKFTPESGSVRVTAFEDQSGVCVSVMEAGTGVEAPPGEPEEDAGLGLVLAKRLLEMHGGSIHSGTDARGAATFTATIPLNRQNQGGWINAA
jgi:signal transduction histidine kinase